MGKYLLTLSAILVSAQTIAGLAGGSLQKKNWSSHLLASYGNDFKLSSECGGVIEALAGAVQFDLYQNVTSRICIWTIVVPRKSTVQIQLLHDDFDSTCGNCESIEVFGLSPLAQLEHKMKIRRGDRALYNITGGSLVQIAFLSHIFSKAQGFVLKFEGVGPDRANSTGQYDVNSYKVFNRNADSAGSIRLPESGSEIEKHQLVVLTIQPPRTTLSEPLKAVALNIDSVYIPHQYASCYSPVFLRVGEVGWELNYPVTRYQGCGWANSKYNNRVTILSENVALVLTFFTSVYPETSFGVSWELADDI